MADLAKDLLRELFDYQDGQLFWKESRGRIKDGDVAGCLDKANGYMRITINKKSYSVHRVIWIYHNGSIDDSLCIDHINRARNDNNIENLRLVTQQENTWNMANVKGYHWNKRNKKWQTQIKANGSSKHIGYFDNEQEAHQAYLNAKQELHIITQH